MTRIDLKEVQLVVNRILDHAIQDCGLTHVDIDQPFYWSIEYDELYDMRKEPQNITVGSLIDDWDFLKNVRFTNTNVLVLQLAQVAPLIAYIGEVVGRQVSSKGT